MRLIGSVIQASCNVHVLRMLPQDVASGMFSCERVGRIVVSSVHSCVLKNQVLTGNVGMGCLGFPRARTPREHGIHTIIDPSLIRPPQVVAARCGETCERHPPFTGSSLRLPFQMANADRLPISRVG